MKYKILTAIIAWNLAACGAEEASNVNSVIDNVQEGQESEDDRDEVEVNTTVKTPKNKAVTTTTTTTTTTVTNQPTTFQPSSATEDLRGLPDEGVLSLRVSEMDFECTDWSRGSLPASTKEMLVVIDDGRISFAQTARSSSASSAVTVASSEIISSTPIEGWIEDDGSFTAQGSSVVDDYSLGYLRSTYHFSGVLTSAGWNGKHTMTMFAEDYFVTCEYEGTFTGSWK